MKIQATQVTQQTLRAFLPTGTDQSMFQDFARDCGGCTITDSTGHWWAPDKTHYHELVKVWEFIITADAQYPKAVKHFFKAGEKFLQDNPNEQIMFCVVGNQAVTLTRTGEQNER